jgi:hypothetical protein
MRIVTDVRSKRWKDDLFVLSEHSIECTPMAILRSTDRTLQVRLGESIDAGTTMAIGSAVKVYGHHPSSLKWLVAVVTLSAPIALGRYCSNAPHSHFRSACT